MNCSWQENQRITLTKCRWKSADNIISKGNGQAIGENTSYLHLKLQSLFPDFGIFVLNKTQSVASTES
ncbi:hypothetical protein [Tolypothrix sp. NIES-4075]|uniref:hypothetical protein n=1 Tax=Tolypothrix sp. NIES-4075 TaxID=2005459 RepID=UPI000B5C2341|nr:hypothetical protein [Tolypothrix sp. NIES-4075]